MEAGILLHKEFEASLEYMILCLKKIKVEKRNEI